MHRLFGWKFWCVVCGAAPLDPELEAFWRKLGFLVVQGYGLTETAPIVTLNHPLRAVAAARSAGPIARRRSARLRRTARSSCAGENVTSGYYAPEQRLRAAQDPVGDGVVFEDGWFHTGDIGELDETGRLLIKGRKKEMIVTPQGLNVFPEDVERALLGSARREGRGVVGLHVNGEERMHAVLVLAPGADVDARRPGRERAARGSSARLEHSIWPGASLPRTEGTQKLKRREHAAMGGRRRDATGVRAGRRRRASPRSCSGSRRAARSDPRRRSRSWA